MLFSLYNSSKSVKDLELEFGKKSNNISRALNELRNLNLVIKLVDKKFSLSSTGFLLTKNLENLMCNWDSIDVIGDFWNHHSIESIPSYFLKGLSFFNNSSLVKSTITDFSKPIDTYLSKIRQSKEIYMILPVFSKIFIDYIVDSLSNFGGYFELITTQHIIDLILDSEGGDLFRFLVDNGSIFYYLVDDVMNIFLTSTDSFASLFLFFDDVIFDNSEMLLVEDFYGLISAKRFFNYYKSSVLK